MRPHLAALVASCLLHSAAASPALASDAASLLLDVECRLRSPDEGTACGGLSGFLHTRTTFYDASPASPLHVEERLQRYDGGTIHLHLDAGADAALFRTLFDTPETSILRQPNLRIRVERRKADGTWARVTDVRYRPVAHALYARHSEDTPMLLDRIDEAQADAIEAARQAAEPLVANEAAARQAADTTLQGQIDALRTGDSGLPTDCAAGQILVSNGAGAFACGLMCSYPMADCDGSLATACEANVARSAAHCGGCGQACSGAHVNGSACVDGACEGACAEGYADCNGDLRADGCEASLSVDTAHCGACGDACSGENVAASTCAAGECGGPCEPGFGDCNDDLRQDGCERVIADDPLNCGGCDRACSDRNVEPVCQGADCVGACASGFEDCNGDKQADGCEAHLATSTAHCGACGNACPQPPGTQATCTDGVCDMFCSTGTDCNGDMSDGCEAQLNSIQHCGGCNAPCSTNHVVNPSCSPNCIGPICLPPFQCRGSCAAGYGNCDGDLRSNGCESNLQRDAANCGACGRRCAGGETCMNGVCMGFVLAP